MYIYVVGYDYNVFSILFVLSGDYFVFFFRDKIIKMWDVSIG